MRMSKHLLVPVTGTEMTKKQMIADQYQFNIHQYALMNSVIHVQCII